jgi:probable HAF family extracellular repeat protein
MLYLLLFRAVSNIGISGARRARAILCVGLLLICSSIAARAGAQTAPIVTTDLGTLGGTRSAALAVNANGQIVGYANTADETNHAFSWTQAGGMVDLGTLGGTYSFANAVNANGQVVGWANTTGDAEMHAFSWTQAGGMVDLGTFGGINSEATAVNANGQVVGWALTTGSYASHAFSWTQAGGMVDLGTLGGISSTAIAVNANGQVVGWASTTGDTEHAFSWTQAGGMVDLGTLGGTYCHATAVDDNGQVVGACTLSGDVVLHGFSWTQAGGMVDLGTLGGTHSEAAAVNANGQIVGISNPAGDWHFHAFSWTQAGGMVDLGTLGGPGSNVLAVTANGQVVGYSDTTPSGAVMHAFSWTPAGGMVDLGTLGGDISFGIAVNANGQVVGQAYTADNQGHAVLWKPAEPDLAPPNVACASADGVWHAVDVAVPCTAEDSDSGLADSADAAFSLATNVSPGTETASASTESRSVCDATSNCAPAGPIADNMVDKKAPGIVITRPANMAVYQLNEPLTAAYTCSDGGSGVSSCAANVANGSPVDTSTLGSKSFTVTAADAVGNTSSYTVTYDVRRTLTAVEPVKLWIGLKNSDSVGLRLDIRAELLVNGVVVGSGGLNNVASGSSGFNNALLQTVAVSLTSGPVDIPAGAVLSLRASARRTCLGGGQNSGTPRMWYNGPPVDSGPGRDAGSRTRLTMANATSNHFLRDGFALSTMAGSARDFVEVTVNSSVACAARPFVRFGTWSVSLP